MFPDWTDMVVRESAVFHGSLSLRVCPAPSPGSLKPASFGAMRRDTPPLQSARFRNMAPLRSARFRTNRSRIFGREAPLAVIQRSDVRERRRAVGTFVREGPERHFFLINDPSCCVYYCSKCCNYKIPNNQKSSYAREGHHVLSQLFGENDLFTTMITAQMECGKLQYDV